MPPVEFEPMISAGERPQTYALDRAATGTGDISILKEKIKSAYYQGTQIEINKIPRLQKLQSMFKIKEIMKIANKATAEKLKDKDLNLNYKNHLIYAAATVITEEMNGTRCNKS